ncbi:MAG: Sua5/YciO/YrdC/YwlC family protein [Pseudomonadota bacterium]
MALAGGDNAVPSAALAALREGAVVAYPTEAVFGLGCDPARPEAVAQLLAIKDRPQSKGLILIAAEVEQFSPWVDVESLARDYAHVLERWPGPVTWLVPCRLETPRYLRGDFDTLAVRVTAHPGAAALCRQFGGALVSTSANPAGQPPARSVEAVADYFPEMVTVPGSVDAGANPSTIIDAQSQQVLRP